MTRKQEPYISIIPHVIPCFYDDHVCTIIGLFPSVCFIFYGIYAPGSTSDLTVGVQLYFWHGICVPSSMRKLFVVVYL